MSRQPIFYIILLSTLAALAGASVVLQQVLNANLRGALDSAAWSGFVSYTSTSAICGPTPRSVLISAFWG
jgi:uncharacterized membrane protein YdcZ (DUF606 family)